MTPFEAVLTASAIPLSNGDRFQVIIATRSADNIPLTLRILQIDDAGGLVHTVEPVTPVPDTLPQTFDFPLTAGLLVSAVLFTYNTPVAPGLIQAQFSIMRGSVDSASAQLPLVSGPISTGYQLNFPFTQSIDAGSVVAGVRATAGSAPAAGAPALIYLDGDTITEVLGATASLTTNAAVADRHVFWSIAGTNGGNVSCYAPDTQPALTTITYSIFLGGSPAPEAATSPTMSIPAPSPIFCYPGILTFGAISLQAGDAFSLQSAIIRRNLIT